MPTSVDQQPRDLLLELACAWPGQSAIEYADEQIDELTNVEVIQLISDAIEKAEEA